MAKDTAVTWTIRRSQTGRVTARVSTSRNGKREKATARRERWLKTSMRKETPVITGRLRDGWRTDRPSARVYVASNPTRYAAAVDVNGKSAGYIRRGLQEFRRRVRAGR